MTKLLPVAAFIAAMILIIVAVDVLFFRSSEHTWERLASNVGIVLVFIAFYLRFFK